MAFFVDFALFFRTIDGLVRYGTLEKLDKNGLPIVFPSILTAKTGKPSRDFLLRQFLTFQCQEDHRQI
jgi:hypothetical protein